MPDAKPTGPSDPRQVAIRVAMKLLQRSGHNTVASRETALAFYTDEIERAIADGQAEMHAACVKSATLAFMAHFVSTDPNDPALIAANHRTKITLARLRSVLPLQAQDIERDAERRGIERRLPRGFIGASLDDRTIRIAFDSKENARGHYEQLFGPLPPPAQDTQEREVGEL